MTHPDTGPFREPVDWRGLELFDYPEIIKKMMDLGTIQKKLERNQYNTAWEVAQDIRLVWNNCTCVFLSSLFVFDSVGGLLPYHRWLEQRDAHSACCCCIFYYLLYSRHDL